MTPEPKSKRSSTRVATKGKTAAVFKQTKPIKAKPVKAKSATAKPTTYKPIKAPTGRHFKVGDRVQFDYGQRKVEGTVTSTSGDRVHVDMYIASDEPTPGLFRENELRSA